MAPYLCSVFVLFICVPCLRSLFVFSFSFVLISSFLIDILIRSHFLYLLYLPSITFHLCYLFVPLICVAH